MSIQSLNEALKKDVVSAHGEKKAREILAVLAFQCFGDNYPENYDEKPWELRAMLEAKMVAGEITVDFNGHCRKKRIKVKFPKEYVWEFRRDHGHLESLKDNLFSCFMKMTTKEQVAAFQYVLDNPGKKWVEMNGLLDGSDQGCHECGKKVRYKFNGRTIKAMDACPHPTGQPPISFDIKVPSGVMVFGNYFKGVEIDINAAFHAGEFGYTEHLSELKHYASKGVAQVYCGNSCPSIHKEKDQFWIGNSALDEDYDKVVDSMPGKEVCSVCTDLWAWSMTDLRRALELEGTVAGRDLVRVTPGTYRVTQKFYSKGGYGPPGKADIFATMERVGKRMLKTKVTDAEFDKVVKKGTL